MEPIDELKKEIGTYSIILEDLDGNSGFNELCKIFKNDVDIIDSQWHLITDEKSLYDFRVKKHAYEILLSMIESVRTAKQQLELQLEELEDPEKAGY